MPKARCSRRCLGPAAKGRRRAVSAGRPRLDQGSLRHCGRRHDRRSRSCADAAPDRGRQSRYARCALGGAVLIGRSNMPSSLFPGSASTRITARLQFLRPRRRRIPGGIVLGRRRIGRRRMAAFALGTIPAARCASGALLRHRGVKPTRARVPSRERSASTTLDRSSARATVACCATVFQSWRRAAAGARPRALGRLRLGVPKNTCSRPDIEVMEAFDSAIQRLSRRGAKIVELSVRSSRAAKANQAADFPPQAYVVHRQMDRARVRRSIRACWSGSCAADPSWQPDYIECSRTGPASCSVQRGPNYVITSCDAHGAAHRSSDRGSGAQRETFRWRTATAAATPARQFPRRLRADAADSRAPGGAGRVW